MAIASATQWDVRTTGSDTNGGGFDSTLAGAGTDYSLQNSAQLALTDVVANGTTTLTSATAGFTSAMVGNTIYLSGGSGSLTAVRRQITGYTNSTTITVDATVATGTGITGNVGGSLATPAEPFTRGVVAGNTVWLKNGTYTTAVKIAMTGGSSGKPVQLIGYNSTHGDISTYTNGPLINATATISSFGIVSLENGYNLLAFVKVGSNSQSVIRGIYEATYSQIIGCLATGAFTNEGISSTGIISSVSRCDVDSSGITAIVASYCSAKGKIMANTAFRCIAYDTGGSVKGFERQQAGPVYWCECEAVNCGGDGFKIEASSNARNTILERCLSVHNGGYGYNSGASSNCAVLIDCAAQGNTSGAKNNILNAELGSVTTSTLTGDPLTASTTKNFTLDNTASEGAALRGVSYAWQQLTTTTSYGDIGAVQHQDSGGGGGLAMPVSGPA